MSETSFLAVFLAVYGVILLFFLLFSLACYILTSLGFYALAKRRGIPQPGWAWVPIGGQRWILGSLADQYAYLAEGKQKRQRHLLLWLDIACTAISAVFVAYMVNAAVAQFAYTSDAAVASLVAGALGGYFLLLVLAVVLAVFYYIALHKVYKSCDPKNATLFLVLSIVVSVTLPFFVFFSRKKDLGMPPAPPAGDQAEALGEGPGAQ